MDRMYSSFKRIEVTNDEVESAWLMDYERAKGRWPGNDAQARRTTRPRRTLRIFLRQEKYRARHSRELTDEEVRTYQRLAPNTAAEDVRKMSDLSFKVSMARSSACNCDCGKPELKAICTFGVFYGYEMARTYVPNRWRRNACFEADLLPDGAMEP